MILILLLCAFFSLLLSFIIIKPLVDVKNQQLYLQGHEGFADEDELRAVLSLRDALFQKLVYGKSNDKRCSNLSDSVASDLLTTVCMRLYRADLPVTPTTLNAPIAVDNVTKDSSSNSISFPHGLGTVLIGVLLASLMMFTEKAQAQSDFKVPAPLVQGDVLVPQLHQFVIYPVQGSARVQYLGLFSSTVAVPSAKIRFSLPDGFSEFSIKNPGAVLADSANNAPVAVMPVVRGDNEIRAEFDLVAPFGTVRWENPKLGLLPGTVLVLMPEQEGTMRKILQGVLPNINLWPARLINTPADFENSRVEEPPNPNDPNAEVYARLKIPKNQIRQLLRRGNETSPFPSFEIVGIVPNRLPLYVLATLMGCVLFGFSLYSLRAVLKKPVL